MTNNPRSDNRFEKAKPGTDARTRAEAAIEELRQRGGIFVDAVRATRMAMALTDPTLPGNPIVFVNQSFLNLSGYRMHEVLGQQPYFMNGPDTDPKDSERFRRILERDQDGVVETVQYAKNGRRFVATVLLSAFKDDAGNTLHHFLSWADVTDRVAADQDADELRSTQAALRDSESKLSTAFDQLQSENRHVQRLLAELQHRVRNTLSVVRSIVRRTAAGSANVDEFQRHLDGRLGAFARIQSYVTRDPEGGIDLELMIRDELLAHAVEGDDGISIDGPPVRLNSKQAETLGMAIHELTANAVKHGAFSSNGNRVAVSWSTEKDAGRLLCFNWVETLRYRRLDHPERANFGTELLDRIMRYDLDAEPELEFHPDGFRYRVAIPLSVKSGSH